MFKLSNHKKIYFKLNKILHLYFLSILFFNIFSHHIHAVLENFQIEKIEIHMKINVYT